MNCKPGDLAVIVRGRVDTSNVGKFVTVRRALGHFAAGETFRGPDGGMKSAPTDDFYWWIEGPSLRCMERSVDAWHVEDSRLRPIRDPGEDARDETLNWLPVPSQEKTTA
jgi:hypothetical protein